MSNQLQSMPRRPMASGGAVYQHEEKPPPRSLPVGGVMYPWNRVTRRHRRADQPDLSWQSLAVAAVVVGVIMLIIVVTNMVISGPVVDPAAHR